MPSPPNCPRVLVRIRNRYVGRDRIVGVGRTDLSQDSTNRWIGQDRRRTPAGEIKIVPPWADNQLFPRLAKRENWFAEKYDQIDHLRGGVPAGIDEPVGLVAREGAVGSRGGALVALGDFAGHVVA